MTSQEPVRTYQVRVSRNGGEYTIGVVHRGYFHHGWRFYPHVAGRARSRKAWPTAEQAVPRWVGVHKLVEATVPSSA